MIAYLDSSSLVKLYVQDESGVEETARVVREADGLVTSQIAYVEVRAAFARASRAGRFESRQSYEGVVRQFEADWPEIIHVSITDELVKHAGDLAETHGLRAYDATHLAAMLAYRESGPPLLLSSWDDELNRAASAESFVIAHA